MVSVKKATSKKAAMSRDFETENSNARNKCLGSEASDSCTKCQEDLQSLRNGVLGHLTKDSAATLLEPICDTFSEQDQKLCLQALEEHVPLVLNQLKRVDTKQICASVGQCSDDQDTTALKFESVSDGNTSMHGEVEGGIICPICATAMAYVHHLLSDRRFQDTIFKMLWNACKLTGPFERRCRVYVFRYGKKVIELAKEKLTPKLCQTFGLCDKVQMFQDLALTRHHGTCSRLCVLCKHITSLIHRFIHARHAKQRVIAFTKWMCDKLPSPFSAMCDGFAAFVLPEVFDYLKSNCQIIDHLCKVIYTKQILGICRSEEMFNLQGCPWSEE